MACFDHIYLWDPLEEGFAFGFDYCLILFTVEIWQVEMTEHNDDVDSKKLNEEAEDDGGKGEDELTVSL